MYYKEMGDLIAEDEIFARLIYKNVETDYLISSYGRVWSEKNNIFMSIQIDKRSNRKKFSICIDGIQYTIYLARAIALAFLGPGEGLDADHIDNDCTNDVLENIQWLTPEENKKKANKSGLIKHESKPGDKSNYHVYNEDIIHEVCKMMEDGYDVKSISIKTGVSHAVIRSIKSHRNWTIISSQYNIDNCKPTKPEKLPDHVSEFIKNKLIEGHTNKDIEQMVFDIYGIESTYSSISNHKRRLKSKGLL